MNLNSTQKWIGAHVSSGGGHELAVQRAVDIGANCLQFFSGSPRVWTRKPLSEINAEKLYSEVEKNHLGPIFTHALYLVNLTSDNPASVEKSIKGFVYDLEFDALIHGAGVVIHLGSHTGRGWAAVREGLVETIAKIIEQTPDSSTFLIEGSAGQQGKLCSDLADIKWVLDQLQSNRVGWALDTCHTFCAGYSLGKTEGTIEKPDLQRSGTAEQVIGELDLWRSLRVIHVNDSRDAFGSGRDRHANLGEGHIPAEDLHHFLNLPEVQPIPLILEVPGEDDQGPDAINIERLRAITGA